MLSVILLSVIMLNVVMPNVMAPLLDPVKKQYQQESKNILQGFFKCLFIPLANVINLFTSVSYAFS
jgi:hypothetical protein